MTRLSSLGVLASNWRDTIDVNTSTAHAFLFGNGGQAPDSGSGANSVATPR
jgi:hypothetical protein